MWERLRSSATTIGQGLSTGGSSVIWGAQTAGSYAKWGVQSAYRFMKSSLRKDQAEMAFQEMEMKEALSPHEIEMAEELSFSVKCAAGISLLLVDAPMLAVGFVALGLLPKDALQKLGNAVVGTEYTTTLMDAQMIAGHTFSCVNGFFPKSLIRLEIKKTVDDLVKLTELTGYKGLSRAYKNYHVGERLWLWSGVLLSVQEDLTLISQYSAPQPVPLRVQQIKYRSGKKEINITDISQCRSSWMNGEKCEVVERRILEKDYTNNTVKTGVLNSTDNGRSWIPVTFEEVSAVKTYKASYEEGVLTHEATTLHLTDSVQAKSLLDVTTSRIEPSPSINIVSQTAVLFAAATISTQLQSTTSNGISGAGLVSTCAFFSLVADVSALSQTPKRSVEQQFPPVVDLNNLDPSTGFMVVGEKPGDLLGESVAGWDYKNSGKEAAVVAAVWASPNSLTKAGEVYVIPGSGEGVSSPYDLNRNTVIKIPGIRQSGAFGKAMTVVKNMNGDTFSALAVSAYTANVNGFQSGEVNVFFGSSQELISPVDLTTAMDGNKGFSIPGESSGDTAGFSLGSGDWNGDGLGDLMVGAAGANNNTGRVYVIFGRTTGWPAVFNLSSLSGDGSGFVVNGVAPNDRFGWSVGDLGDINKDGISDMGMGAPEASYGTVNNGGVLYALFGKSNGWAAEINITAINASEGFYIPGPTSDYSVGLTVNTAGNFFNDGASAFMFGATWGGANSQGEVCILSGNKVVWPLVVDINNLSPADGVRIFGESVGNSLGTAITPIGDYNGDNIDDVAIGAGYISSNNIDKSGKAYFLFGSDTAASYNLSALTGNNGQSVPGIFADQGIGFYLGMVKNFTGDGRVGVLMGAHSSSNFTQPGNMYTIFGEYPETASMFASCPDNQPLTMIYNRIEINKGQTRGLTPYNLGAACGNSTTLNLGTEFTITGIRFATIEIRNASGIFSTANKSRITFFGSQQANNEVNIVPDNTTNVPVGNFTGTDRKSIVSGKLNIQFNLVPPLFEVNSVVLNIPLNTTTILTPDILQVSVSGINPKDVKIDVGSLSGVLITRVNSNEPVTILNAYELENGLLKITTNTTKPGGELGVGDGSGRTQVVKPLVNIFGENNSSSFNWVPVYATASGIIAATALGVGCAFYKYKYKPLQDIRIEKYEEEQVRDQKIKMDFG